MSALTHKEQISAPPKYLTTDGKAVDDSVRRLKDLKPLSLAIANHGEPIKGEELTRHLNMLVDNFEESIRKIVLYQILNAITSELDISVIAIAVSLTQVLVELNKFVLVHVG